MQHNFDACSSDCRPSSFYWPPIIEDEKEFQRRLRKYRKRNAPGKRRIKNCLSLDTFYLGTSEQVTYSLLPICPLNKLEIFNLLESPANLNVLPFLSGKIHPNIFSSRRKPPSDWNLSCRSAAIKNRYTRSGLISNTRVFKVSVGTQSFQSLNLIVILPQTSQRNFLTHVCLSFRPEDAYQAHRGETRCR